VVKTEPVKQQIPEGLLVSCPGKDTRPWPDVEAIVSTYDATEASRATCAAQLERIRQWNRGQG